MKQHFAALCLSCLLDLALGDPQGAPHPVRALGALIAGLERPLRNIFPKTLGGERAAGAALVLIVLAAAAGVTEGALFLAAKVSPWLAFALETLVGYQCLAARSLRDESMKVYAALTRGTLDEARKAVSMIVGRDTDRLDREDVAKAAVETVAENASDGVIAPLIYLAVGGPVLGITYKAINTMDSMVGYQNARYKNFGFCAAKLDDGANFFPARLSGGLLCLAAPLAGLDGLNAWRIFRRDRLCHKSPNSAHTEAATAGALGVQLAGSNYYFGKLVEKPTIGDSRRRVEPEDIIRTNRLMFTGGALAAILFDIVPLAVLILL